jgi:hypothetical protein
MQTKSSLKSLKRAQLFQVRSVGQNSNVWHFLQDQVSSYVTVKSASTASLSDWNFPNSAK